VGSQPAMFIKKCVVKRVKNNKCFVFLFFQKNHQHQAAVRKNEVEIDFIHRLFLVS
jgi:hypothetical protein